MYNLKLNGHGRQEMVKALCIHLTAEVIESWGPGCERRAWERFLLGNNYSMTLNIQPILETLISEFTIARQVELNHIEWPSLERLTLDFSEWRLEEKHSLEASTLFGLCRISNT